MFGWRAIAISSVVLLMAALLPARAQQSPLEDRTDSKIEAKENSKPSKSGKPATAGKRTVWNLDGGVFFSTDGHMQNGSCFRLNGSLNEPDFFNGLRRVDTDKGSSYLLHDKPVAEYPEQVEVTIHLLDSPCGIDLKDVAVRPPITPELLRSLRMQFFWKEGVVMQPVETVHRTAASSRRIGSYVTGPAAEELAPRFEWTFGFTVNSSGVPLTKDLALVMDDAEHHICARVAARL